jgi:hypothetical protein
MEKTYRGFLDWDAPSRQREYTEPAKLLDEDGTLLAAGWARRNVFDYDRTKVKLRFRRKEWDFYQISNGSLMLQLSFANISLGGYASAVLVDLRAGKTLCSKMAPFVGGKDKYILPPKGDVPNEVRMEVGKSVFEALTGDRKRTLRFTLDDVRCEFEMDILPGQENITTVLPFDGFPDRYFMTTKQNCLPCGGVFRFGKEEVRFEKETAFCVLDWGRVCTPYALVWYWGNGSAWLTDAAGEKHLFGFEITWGIGDESKATETCVFYDGKAHKFGPVDVKTFPKPDRYMEPWEFVSQDGRFRLTMQPFYDHHSDLNVGVMRMHSHQVHGRWSGDVTLDDGTVLEIRDMYAFCEYVENRW